MRALLLLCLFAMVARGQSSWPPKQDAYDLEAAFRSVMYSASAYSTNPTECIPDSWQFNSSATFSASDGDGDTLFAFAGVNHEMKEVVMSFRGTSKPAQLVVEFFSSLAIKPVFDGDNTYLAFDYWVDAVTKLQTQSMPYVSRLLTAHPDYKLLVTGHSLGAAMASVWTSRFFNFGYAPPTTTVWEYSFGQPRVGNYDYATLHDSLPITSYRLSHYRDPIVHLPFCHGLLSCSAKSGTTWAYHHGVEVFYNAHDMPASSSGQVCLGTPHNEDEKCSAGYLGDSVDDHLYYFDLHVGVYCPDTASNFVPSLRSNSYSSSYGEGLTMNMQYRPSNPPLHEIVNMQQAESALEAARAARRDE